MGVGMCRRNLMEVRYQRFDIAGDPAESFMGIIQSFLAAGSWGWSRAASFHKCCRA